MTMEWAYVMNSHCNQSWITLLSKTSTHSLPWRVTILHGGFQAIMTLKSRRHRSQNSLKYAQDSMMQWTGATLLYQFSLILAFRLPSKWSQRMVFTSTFMKQLALTMLPCTWTLTTKTWYLSHGLHLMQPVWRVTCRRLVRHHGVRLWSVMTLVTCCQVTLSWTSMSLVSLKIPLGFILQSTVVYGGRWLPAVSLGLILMSLAL